MDMKTVMVYGTIEIKTAYDLEKETARLLVCVDNPPYEDYKQFMFIDEIIIGEKKYVVSGNRS